MTALSTVLSRVAVGASPPARPAERGTTVSDERGHGASASVAFCGVSKVFRSPGGSVGALVDIDAEVAAGRIFGIIGRSGAGKSTLLRLVNRLERPTSGQVLVDGEDVGRLDGEALIGLRRRVGMVFQHFNLLAAKTARDNVALPLVVAGVPRREVERRVDEALALVGLEDKANQYPSRLSGGQKQRIGIARALVNRPRLLLCDEATSALDPEATLSILRLLADINRRLGLTIILITHEMAVVREICDDVLVLSEGRAVETGPVWRVFGEPAHPATQALLRPEGRRLPRDLAARLAPTARPGRRDAALIELHFSGRTPPDLARLATSRGAAIRLLDGALDRLGGHTQGRLLVSVPLDADGHAPDLTRFADHMELLGYVADDD